MNFNLSDFLPYLLSLAAETVGAEFQTYYTNKYGMLRTEWRVLFHVGKFEGITAKGICQRASLHKTKVSRAIVALEKKRFLKRDKQENDRRIEELSLTKKGFQVFEDLQGAAAKYQEKLTIDMTEKEVRDLNKILLKLAKKR